MTTAIASRAKLDHRNHVRVTPSPDKPIRVDINGEDFIEILHVADISEGGIGFRIPYGFSGCRIDGWVSLVLKLPLKKPVLLHLSGKIKHVSGDRFGVRFLDVPENARHAIQRYIANYLWEKSFLAWLQYKWNLLNAP